MPDICGFQCRPGAHRFQRGAAPGDEAARCLALSALLMAKQRRPALTSPSNRKRAGTQTLQWAVAGNRGTGSNLSLSGPQNANAKRSVSKRRFRNAGTHEAKPLMGVMTPALCLFTLTNGCSLLSEHSRRPHGVSSLEPNTLRSASMRNRRDGEQADTSLGERELSSLDRPSCFARFGKTLSSLDQQ